jgi:hypothetical protein
MSHTCHARFCSTAVPPEKLMCKRHWMAVPEKIRRQVSANYRVGQCDDRRPSAAWHDAAGAAIGWVALREGAPVRRGEVIALLTRGYRLTLLRNFVRQHGEEARQRITQYLDKLGIEGPRGKIVTMKTTKTSTSGPKASP